MSFKKSDINAHFKAMRTDIYDLKEYLKSVPASRVLTPGEMAEEAGVEMTLYAMRATGQEFAKDARNLSAAFALGPDGEIAETYKRRQKGCNLFDEGIQTLVEWARGSATDAVAAKMRWDLSKRVMEAKSKNWLHSAFEAIIGGLAPDPWGGCAHAHVCAKYAYGQLQVKDEVQAGRDKSENYHAFLIRGIL